MKTQSKMEQQQSNMRLSASEKRFVHEMKVIAGMSLQELLNLEKLRMPVGA